MQISTLTQTLASPSSWTWASDKRTSSATAFEDRTAGINLLRDSDLLMLMDARNAACYVAERGLGFSIEHFMSAVTSFVLTVESHGYLKIGDAQLNDNFSFSGEANNE